MFCDVARVLAQWPIMSFLSACDDTSAELQRDVYPLPLLDLSAEDVKALYQQHELGPYMATTSSTTCWGNPSKARDLRLGHFKAWVWSIIFVSSFMYYGCFQLIYLS